MKIAKNLLNLYWWFFRARRIRISLLWEVERWLSGQEDWLIFQRTQVQIPAPAWQLTAICITSPWGSNALSWPLWAFHTSDAHTCRQNIHWHKIKIQSRLIVLLWKWKQKKSPRWPKSSFKCSIWCQPSFTLCHCANTLPSPGSLVLVPNYVHCALFFSETSLHDLR